MANSFDAGIWAVFLEKITVKIGCSRKHIKVGEFTIDSLQTTNLRRDPSKEEIQKRCDDPKVKAYMKLNSYQSKAVYMITGIKVASGFTFKQSDRLSGEASCELGAALLPCLGLGTKAAGSSDRNISHGFKTKEDIIYAYQVSKIEPKGWGRNKHVVIQDYTRGSDAMSICSMTSASPQLAEDEEASFQHVTAKELQQLENDIKVVCLPDGEAEQGVIVFRAADEEGYFGWVRRLLGHLSPAASYK
ncbi:hypothetical protein HER10_EVM0012453 [Colletotrichum scovillei]|uniref:uncharacterized protein n=1 Tax=Colletotrichum scovillei TaxID=1209932 RepID=UPI0015C3DFE4|nr:uncharacterized protein HER10_EVM0012453 [Colletotrichum scovillei]KAF4772984.1 hypothetical protein HER10_EVM0012453 [Colletotrichum scovillei]